MIRALSLELVRCLTTPSPPDIRGQQHSGCSANCPADNKRPGNLSLIPPAQRNNNQQKHSDKRDVGSRTQLSTSSREENLWLTQKQNVRRIASPRINVTTMPVMTATPIHVFVTEPVIR